MIDRLLDKPQGLTALQEALKPAPSQWEKPARLSDLALVAVCPKCGCASSLHQAGASKERCERHPACRWTP